MKTQINNKNKPCSSKDKYVERPLSELKECRPQINLWTTDTENIAGIGDRYASYSFR
ncbi:MAG: hypothetical protein Q8K42_09830 [Methylobacter sp.]|nr:hypothetical protein [Methylobacter sp.]